MVTRQIFGHRLKVRTTFQDSTLYLGRKRVLITWGLVETLPYMNMSKL